MHPPAAGELATVHERVQAGPEFRELRRRLRGCVFPMSAAFLLWYLAFVLLASYAPRFMATPVSGDDHRGAAGRAAQFVTTFALTAGLRALRAAAGSTRCAEQIRTGMERRRGR